VSDVMNGDDDSVVDERDLYAPDGGGDPDRDYPHLTQYQVQRLQDFINETEDVYESADDDFLDSPEAYAASGIDAAEKKIFAFVNLLLAKRDARIEALETDNKIFHEMFGNPVSREGRYQGVKVLVITSRPFTTDPLVYRAQYLEGPAIGANIRLAHDDIDFIDPVRVVSESYVKGLLERIAALEGKS